MQNNFFLWRACKCVLKVDMGEGEKERIGGWEENSRKSRVKREGPIIC